jgi:hypothetical protein
MWDRGNAMWDRGNAMRDRGNAMRDRGNAMWNRGNACGRSFPSNATRSLRSRTVCNRRVDLLRLSSDLS